MTDRNWKMYGGAVVDHTGRMVAHFYDPNKPADEWLADARLFAAAPDLLDALRTTLALLNEKLPHLTMASEEAAYDIAINRAKAAIAKAEGRSP